jgi:hypothetical protein
LLFETGFVNTVDEKLCYSCPYKRAYREDPKEAESAPLVISARLEELEAT